MVDIHCHILPAVDDGAESDEQSLEMISNEVGGGTKAFVATPHVNTWREMTESARIAEWVHRLRELVKDRGIPVEIHVGCELHASMQIIEALDAGLPITLAGTGKYVLLDTPRMSLGMDFGLLMFELRARSITPIIAHPERSVFVQQSPESMLEYMNQGAVLQVNAASLLGRYGPQAQETAQLLLRRQWAHFMASDAHRPGRRAILATARSLAAEFADASYLETITSVTGQCIADGAPLPKIERRTAGPVKKEKPGMLRRLFGRS